MEGETLRAANDSTMRICGDVTATLDFGSAKATMKITLLDDLIYDALLGIGFFHTYVRSIRPSELRMEMQDESVVSIRKSGLTKIAGSAFVCSDKVTVLPYLESVIACNIINTKPSNDLLCISDTGRLAERYGIMMPFYVFNTNFQAAHIRVINPTSEPVTLHQAARVALLEESEVVTAPRCSALWFIAMQHCRGGPALSLSDVNCDAAYLSVQQRQKLQNLLNNFSDITAVDGQRRGRTSMIEHRIDLPQETAVQSSGARGPDASARRDGPRD